MRGAFGGAKPGGYYQHFADEIAVDPEGPEGSTHRVIRGGSWGNVAGLCRAAFRRRSEPGFRYGFLGFRVAAVPLSPAQSSPSPASGAGSVG